MRLSVFLTILLITSTLTFAQESDQNDLLSNAFPFFKQRLMSGSGSNNGQNGGPGNSNNGQSGGPGSSTNTRGSGSSNTQGGGPVSNSQSRGPGNAQNSQGRGSGNTQGPQSGSSSGSGNAQAPQGGSSSGSGNAQAPQAGLFPGVNPPGVTPFDINNYIKIDIAKMATNVDKDEIEKKVGEKLKPFGDDLMDRYKCGGYKENICIPKPNFYKLLSLILLPIVVLYWLCALIGIVSMCACCRNNKKKLSVEQPLISVEIKQKNEKPKKADKDPEKTEDQNGQKTEDQKTDGQ